MNNPIKVKLILPTLIILSVSLLQFCKKGDDTPSPTLSLPTVTTTVISEITATTATGGGEVTNDGNASVTERGVCWSTTATPTISDNKTSDGTGTGSFTSSLTGLTAITTYYVRAYATNSEGTAYGEQTTFTTTNTGSFTDTRDGKVYKTVAIGNQTWMAENLNYETANSYWYNNSSDSGDIYGRLYTWDAAMAGASSSNSNPSGVQGVCPSGWHLPSDNEWKQLEMFLGMSQSEADTYGFRGTDEGKKMKSTSGWRDNRNGTNSSGFNALPGGLRTTYRSQLLSQDGLWWSSSEYSSSASLTRTLFYANDNVNRFQYNKPDCFSVRCLKD